MTSREIIVKVISDVIVEMENQQDNIDALQEYRVNEARAMREEE